MSSVIKDQIAKYKEELTKKTEYLAQVQNAERQTTQEVIALRGAITALEETEKGIIADQNSGTVECEVPQ